jgi:hypothetical protein
LPDGHGFVVARGQDFLVQSQALPIGPNDRDLVIFMESASPLSGRIDTELGPVNFGEISVHLKHRSARSLTNPDANWSAGTSPDHFGIFQFVEIPFGIVDLEVRTQPANAVVAEVVSIVAPGGSPVLDERLDSIRLVDARTVTLQVLSASGEGIPSVALRTGDRSLHDRFLRSHELKSSFEPGEIPRSWDFEFTIGKEPMPVTVLAPGFLPEKLFVDGSSSVTLKSAPQISLLLSSALPMPKYGVNAIGGTELRVQLVPEDATLLMSPMEFSVWQNHVAIEGLLDLKNPTTPVTFATIGPGRYRVFADSAPHSPFA